MGFETSFFVFNIMSVIIPVLVVGMFIFAFIMMSINGVRAVKQNAKNNASPILKVTATVTAKRTEMKSYRGGEMNHHRTRTNYFATFEVESGDRMEFAITGEESGILMEGDQGMLEFQGTRYLNFTRV